MSLWLQKKTRLQIQFFQYEPYEVQLNNHIYHYSDANMIIPDRYLHEM